MEDALIEACSGTGSVYANGKHVGEAEYDLRILQKMYQSGPTIKGGTTRIKGTVELESEDPSEVLKWTPDSGPPA